jgi:hypothetical protein
MGRENIFKNCIQSCGRALYISEAGSLYVSTGYSIYRSDDNGRSWLLDCCVPSKGWKPLGARFSLGSRLLRFNIQALQVLPDGSRVAIARDGIYRAERGAVEMRRTWGVTRGSRPINLSVDGNRVLFGEYGGAEMDLAQVRIYCSEDCGKNFEPVYEFPLGDVHHIHNVVVDRYANHYWVLAGDHGRTSGIGILSKDYRHLDWVARGSQMVRAVSILVRPDCLIYGSDSELEQNYVVKLDKRTGRCDRVLSIDGSSLYAADFGKMGLISTCVEPSQINTGRHSSLYSSEDGANWTRQLSLRKDCWHDALFQFGLIVLPYVQSQNPEYGMFSGQALSHNHDKISLFKL